MLDCAEFTANPILIRLMCCIRGLTSSRSTVHCAYKACSSQTPACAEQPEIARAIHKVLEERGVSLPACHFRTSDVELVRYAITVGLLTARTPEDRYKAMSSLRSHHINQDWVPAAWPDQSAGLQCCSSKLEFGAVCRAGVLSARRKKVVEAAAQRAQATAEWLESHEFMPQAELSSWVDVVRHQLPNLSPLVA